MVQRRDGSGFELKSLAIAFGSDLDGHDAPQARVHCAINGSHAARADLLFDFIRTELRAGGKDGFRRVGEEAGGRLVENAPAGFHFQHALHAGADFGIRTLQQSRALGRAALLRRVIEIFDLTPTFRCHSD